MDDENKNHIPPPPNDAPLVPEVITETEIQFLDNGTQVAAPSAVDLEKVILGAFLIDNRSGEYIDLLEEEVFYAPKHKLIFRAIQQLHNAGTGIDLLTLCNELRRTGTLKKAGEEYYSVQLTQLVSSSAHIEFHIRVVMQKFILRELIHMSRRTLFQSLHRDPDVFKLTEDIQVKIAKLENIALRRTNEDSKDSKQELKEKVEMQRQGIVPGLPIGVSEFDNWRGGFMKRWLITIAARPGMGKCLGKGTNVMMHNGSIKKVEDVKVGDKLMGPDSKARNVLSLARGREQMYWVRQKQGIDYRVNESHILSLKRSRKLADGSKPILNISVKEWIKKSDKFKTNYKGYKVPIEFSKKNITIDPYFLGIWLGDGNHCSQIIYNEDKEVLDYIEKYSNDLGLITEHPQYGKNMPRTIIKNEIYGKPNFLLRMLREKKLLKNKHIPKNYLLNSRSIRLQLLAGLIDSDGNYQEEYNCFEITQKRKKLAQQIKYLCDTLGFKTSLIAKKATLKSKDYSCTVYRVRISGNLDIVPTKIERKKARKSKLRNDFRVNAIAVEKDIVDDYYGFEIDGDKLFCLEDCTVTHNTTAIISIIIHMVIEKGISVLFFSLEMPKADLLYKMAAALTGIDFELINSGKLTDQQWEHVNAALDKIDESPLEIVDDMSNLDQIVSKTRKSVRDGAKIAFLDYVQLVKTDKDDETSSLTKTTRTFRALKNELNIPFVQLAQLSREPDKRADHRPQLSDLKMSGSLEEDSNMVIFILRPEYYNKNKSKVPVPPGQPNPEYRGEWIVAKGRETGLRDFDISIDFQKTKMESLSDIAF